MRDFVLEKQIMTHDTVFLKLFLLNCIFYQKIGTVLLAGLS